MSFEFMLGILYILNIKIYNNHIFHLVYFIPPSTPCLLSKSIFSRIHDDSEDIIPRQFGYWERLRILEPSFRTSIKSDVSPTKNTMPKPMKVIEPKSIKFVQENSSSGSLNNIYEEMKPLPIEYKINHRFKASSVYWLMKVNSTQQ